MILLFKSLQARPTLLVIDLMERVIACKNLISPNMGDLPGFYSLITVRPLKRGEGS
jgi:hypothetical protein